MTPIVAYILEKVVLIGSIILLIYILNRGCDVIEIVAMTPEERFGEDYDDHYGRFQKRL